MLGDWLYPYESKASSSNEDVSQLHLLAFFVLETLSIF